MQNNLGTNRSTETAVPYGTITITDNYNLLEIRQVRKSETYRKLFLERIAFDPLVW